jgi:hypothetical protein
MRRLSFIALTAVWLLAACGGSSITKCTTECTSSSGSSSGGSSSGGSSGSSSGTTVSIVKTLTLTTSSPTILNDGSTTATLTALALDANNNVVAGVPISFVAKVPSGVIAIQPAATTTGAAGTITAILSTGGNDTVQTITISASSGSLDAKPITVDEVAPSTPTNPIYAIGNGVGTCFVPKLIGGQLTSGSCSAVLSAGNISAGGTTALSLTVVDQNDALYNSTSVIVTFSSPCIASGQAEIIPNGSTTPATSITTTTGSINATYKATGCVGSDSITASATVNGQNLAATGTLEVLAATVGSIEFVSATPTTVGLKGTGLQDTSVVIFQVLSSTGSPEAGQTVDFSINTNVGGLTFSPVSAVSAADGTVQTVVSSGTAHTSVRVTATIPASGSTPAISAQSSQLTVTSGLPTSNSFSIAIGSPNYGNVNKSASTTVPACPNIEAWNLQGVTVPFTVVLSDRYNNPVPNDTAVSFTTNAGSIVGSCPTATTVATTGSTDSGGSAASCFVTWTSASPQPFSVAANSAQENPNGPVNLDALNQYQDGRGQVLAYALGEESFTDLAGTGYYETGDPFIQLSEPFLDENESGTFYSKSVTVAGVTSKLADWFLDYDNTGAYVAPSNSNSFVGIVCTPETNPTTCSASTLPISASHTIILSTSLAGYIVQVVPNGVGGWEPASTPNSFSMGGAPPLTSTIYFQILDEHGNAMGAGSTVSWAAAGADLSVAATGPTSVGCDSTPYRPIAYSGGVPAFTGNTVNVVPNYSGQVYAANLTSATGFTGGTVTVTVNSVGTGSSTSFTIGVTN